MTIEFISRQDRLLRAKQAAESAIQAVGDHADAEVKELLSRAIRWVATQQPFLITDDVWDAMRRSYPQVVVREPRVLGPLMRSAVREGVLVAIECEYCTTESVMVKGHRNKANVTLVVKYRSRLYRA